MSNNVNNNNKLCKNLFLMNKIVPLFIRNNSVFRRTFLYKSCITITSSHSKFSVINSFVAASAMAQKSIKSFFKSITKETEQFADKSISEDDLLKSKQIESPEKTKKSSKRLRLNSDDAISPTDNKSTSVSPDTRTSKKTVKRQRIESSSSEEVSSPVQSPLKEKKPVKTYNSPKSKVLKIKQENNSLNSKIDSKSFNNVKEDDDVSSKEKLPDMKNKSSEPKSPDVKKEKSPITKSPTVKKEKSPKTKTPVVKKEKSPKTKTPVVKKEKSPKTKTPVGKKEKLVTKSPVVNEKEEKTEKDNEKEEKTEKDNENDGKIVPENEYNPSKSKYHPIHDACWRADQEVPYLALAKTFEYIEAISARLKIVEILSNYFRSVLVLTPEDLLPSVYMCLNQLAPAYHSLELGIAETYLMKAVGQCTGRSLTQVKAATQKVGDLGLVAEQARATQRTMFTPPPLKLRKVFSTLKEIAHMTGHSSVNKKISKIQSLYIACRHSEAKYLIRSLEGKLRIGLAEQSVLQALAQACTATPPPYEELHVLDAGKGLTQEQFKSKIDSTALTIKSTYCECPNYDMIIPVLLKEGVSMLPQRCTLTPGIPLKPMLAHPTKGVHEVFNRFENELFTCEYKYDGERAQIHVPSVAGEDKADLANAKIFSRNQEDNTSKYPDIVRRLSSLLGPAVHSCVLDCEAVAYDVNNKQILPFQVLSTRKRKDALESEIKVQVCVFVFDLLFLNQDTLVKQPLQRRRELLHQHFNTVEGEWQFAMSRDCSSTEEVQQFLEESVKGSCEGLMVKTLQGPSAHYDIARRSHNWLKLKKDYLDGVGDTVDVVVIGGYLGKGKRAGVYGGFLLACYDPDTEEFQSLCKIGTGFSDLMLQQLSDTLNQHLIDAPKSYYRFDGAHAAESWFAARAVWEVRCADLSLSPSHRAAHSLIHPDKGVSLRFPRFVRIRDDKTPEQATSARQIADMYLAQDQVRNQNKQANDIDDFY